MTTGDGPTGVPTSAERVLGSTYLRVLAFLRDRAMRGDATARGLAAGLDGYAHLPPLRPMVRSWLADCASERRLIRPTSDPSVASALQSEVTAAEARVGQAADRIWREVVEGIRSGSLRS